MKLCKKCNQTLALDEFGKNYYENDLLQRVCRKCLNANQKRLRDIRALKAQAKLAQVAPVLVA